MPIVVGISLRTAGKIYYFDPEQTVYERGERVLVETARGQELGTVKLPAQQVSEAHIVPPLKPVMRRATPADLQRERLNRTREQRALEICRRLVTELNLPMRLIDAQFTFDGSHVLLHFLADNRVDFRELVRDLAHELHARIELRQVGVRDEAKLLGGYGVCGRQLCCSSFLDNFAPVAINIAKEQGLALNPQKISGMCGRLMCCLAFEYQAYHDSNSTLPHVNATVMTPQGEGKVVKLNVLARMVEVQLPTAPAPVWFQVDELGGMAQTHACCKATDACPRVEGICKRPVGNSHVPPPSPPARRPAEMTTAAPEPEAETPANAKPRRRRRKKPAHPTAAPRQTDVVAAETPAPSRDGQETARRRRPRHKPRPPEGATPPGNLPGAAAPPPTGIPSGRYRPRRPRE